MALVLRILLTRSHKTNPKIDFMVVSFQKDRSCQCHLFGLHKEVPLEHRRLRFSFQINDFKDQTRRPSEHFSASSRRRQSFKLPSFLCQAVLFKELFEHFRNQLRQFRRRRVSTDPHPPCQPDLSIFLRNKPKGLNPKIQKHKCPQKANLAPVQTSPWASPSLSEVAV